MSGPIPQYVLDDLDYANCSVCGDTVIVKGLGTHTICALDQAHIRYAFPQTFIVGGDPAAYATQESHD